MICLCSNILCSLLRRLVHFHQNQALCIQLKTYKIKRVCDIFIQLFHFLEIISGGKYSEGRGLNYRSTIINIYTRILFIVILFSLKSSISSRRREKTVGGGLWTISQREEFVKTLVGSHAEQVVR